jgi:hypothetical protein
MANIEPMASLERDRLYEALPFERLLPLVIEIIPGQASEGLIDIYEPGTYEDRPLRELIDRTLGKEDWSIEEKQILEDINRQLRGGKILWRGQEVKHMALAHAIVEQTEEGEKYLYVPVRVIRPQEGGGIAARINIRSCK